MPSKVTALLFWIAVGSYIEPQPRAAVNTVEQLQGFPLREFKVIGNSIFSDEQILAVTQLKIGGETTPSDFQKALKRLSESGVFESVEFQYGAQGDGYQIAFQVVEASGIYPVRFENMDEPPETLHKVLREKVPLYIGRSPANGPMTKLIGSVLEHHRAQQGKKTKVIGRLAPRPDNENEFELVFQPPSTLSTIAFVMFENTGDLSPLDLQRRFNQAATGVPFSQPRLKELLLHNVTPLYEKKGRLAVVFCPCTTESDPETTGILVRVHVEQGPRYQFGSINFAENLSVNIGELTRMIRFRSGETADMSKVQQALTDIEQKMKAIGYARAFARYDRIIREQDRRVDVVIEVRPGALYRFRKLSIIGLNIEGEAAVRKRWIFESGDPFNATYPDVFLKRIHSMFDNLSKTNSTIRINERTKDIDVELIFQ